MYIFLRSLALQWNDWHKGTLNMSLGLKSIQWSNPSLLMRVWLTAAQHIMVELGQSKEQRHSIRLFLFMATS